MLVERVFSFIMKVERTALSRAMNLCLAAGFPPKELRGTCFLSRTEEFVERDSVDPIWRRCDFTLKDCSNDAEWLKDARRDREESGLKQKEDAEWFSSLEDCQAPMAEGKSDLYAWKQTEEEVDIVFDPGPFAGIRATKKDIAVKFSRRSLFVRLRGRILCPDVELAAEVDPENSFWTFDRDRMELQVTLSKTPAGTMWRSLLKVS
ncbi:NudC domain-containing protein 1 [Durusdinium trenchii]|uniref:NudC domain-containing protein 1 n=1 Tax=Durusdinium trenchii TaxID=1381693 RepID=A0ABP0SFC7_9DINO